MTTKLEEAFTEVAKLPEEEQDAIAAWLLEELSSDRRWEKVFEASSGLLEQLAEEALAEYRAGKTQLLNPEEL